MVIFVQPLLSGNQGFAAPPTSKRPCAVNRIPPDNNFRV
jgi:hypothetical protein